MSLLTTDFFKISETSSTINVLLIKEFNTSEFEENGGIFNELTLEWIFLKNQKNIQFLNSILELNIETLFKIFKAPTSPKSLLKKIAEKEDITEDIPEETPNKYPYKIYDTIFECEKSGFGFKILIANYNEKCIAMYVNAISGNGQGQLNKAFASEYGPLIKKNNGLFNFKLKSIEGEHQYDTSPGWCFSKNSEKLNESLKFFIGNNIDITEKFSKPKSSIKFKKNSTSTSDENKYLAKSCDLFILLTLPLINIETFDIINTKYSKCSYGPIEKILELIEDTENINIKFDINNNINRLIYY